MKRSPGVCWEEEAEEEAAARRLPLPLLTDRPPAAEALAAAASCPAALRVIPLPGAAAGAAAAAAFGGRGILEPCALAIAGAGVLEASKSSSSDGEGPEAAAASAADLKGDDDLEEAAANASHSSSRASLGSDSTLPAPVLSKAATNGVREAAKPFGVVAERSESRGGGEERRREELLLFCAAAGRRAAAAAAEAPSLLSLSPKGVVAGLGAAVGDPTGTRRAPPIPEPEPEEEEVANGVVACLSAAETASAARDSSGPRPSGVLAAEGSSPPVRTAASGCSDRAARGSESKVERSPSPSTPSGSSADAAVSPGRSGALRSLMAPLAAASISACPAARALGFGACKGTSCGSLSSPMARGERGRAGRGASETGGEEGALSLSKKDLILDGATGGLAAAAAAARGGRRTCCRGLGAVAIKERALLRAAAPGDGAAGAGAAEEEAPAAAVAAAAAAAAFFLCGVPPGRSLEGAPAALAAALPPPPAADIVAPALVLAKNDFVLGEGKTGVGARSKVFVEGFFFFFFF